MTEDEMSEEEWDVFIAEHKRTIRPLLDARLFAEAIRRLREWADTERRIDVRSFLLQDLSALLMVSGREDEALAVIHERVELEPDNPISRCSLAGWHFYGHGFYDANKETLRAALEAIDTAVAKARVHGEWLRHCLNDRCRIVVAMKRYDLLEESLREILAMPVRPGVPDTQLEDDFLRQVSEGAIDGDLLARYRAAIAEQEARRAKRRSPKT